MYDEFNNSVNKVSTISYDAVFKPIITEVNSYQKENKKLCVHILSNLMLYSKEKKGVPQTVKSCRSLNECLFYYMKEYKATEDVIIKIFNSLCILSSEVVSSDHSHYYYYNKIY